MIIRSQDKGSIRNFNLISDLVVSKSNNRWEIIACYPYFAQTDCGFSVIGTYSTEAKAIKVLDMMQEAYSRMEDIKCGAVQAQKYDSFCFQMPADEDVEV